MNDGDGSWPKGMLMRTLLVVLALALLIGCRKKGNREDDPPPPERPDVVVRPAQGQRAADLPQPARPKTRIGIRMPNGTPTASQLIFGGGEDGFVGIVSYNLRGIGIRIDVARTATGEAIGTVEVPFEPGDGIALSPDGKWIAVMGSAPFEGHPITLFSPGRPGPGIKFVPYGKAKDGTRGPDLIWVGFAAPDRLITLNARSGFDIFSVPDRKRLGGQPPRPLTSIPFVSSSGIGFSPRNFALSPNGKTLAVFNGIGFTFFDTTTAGATAQTEPLIRPGGSMNFWGSAMSADGSRFVCILSTYNPKPAAAVMVWDAVTGKRLSTASVPDGTGAGCGWWGPNHLVLYEGGQASADVLSVRDGQVVGHIEPQFLGSLKIAVATPGDKLWYVFDDSPTASGGVTPVLVKLSAPPRFSAGRRLTIGPDGLRER